MLNEQNHELVHKVGLLCNAWAEAEDRGREFFINVVDMPVTQMAYSVARCIDIRDVYEASRIAIVEIWDDHRLRDEALSVITYINQTLRPARNRCVHDRWFFHPSLMETRQYDHTPRVHRPQSRQFAVKNIRVSTPMTEDMDNLIYDIRHQAAYLNALMMCVKQHPNFPARETLQERPQRRYLPRQ